MTIDPPDPEFDPRLVPEDPFDSPTPLLFAPVEAPELILDPVGLFSNPSVPWELELDPPLDCPEPSFDNPGSTFGSPSPPASSPFELGLLPPDPEPANPPKPPKPPDCVVGRVVVVVDSGVHVVFAVVVDVVVVDVVQRFQFSASSQQEAGPE